MGRCWCRCLGGLWGSTENDYPGDDRLAELRKSFDYAGFWLTPPPGEKANSWTGKRQAVRDAGFGFLVLANGRLEKQIAKGRGDSGCAG